MIRYTQSILSNSIRYNYIRSIISKSLSSSTTTTTTSLLFGGVTSSTSTTNNINNNRYYSNKQYKDKYNNNSNEIPLFELKDQVFDFNNNNNQNNKRKSKKERLSIDERELNEIVDIQVKLNNKSYQIQIIKGATIKDLYSKVWQKRKDEQQQKETLNTLRSTLRNISLKPNNENDIDDHSLEQTDYLLVANNIPCTNSSYLYEFDLSNTLFRLDLKSEHLHPYAKKISHSKASDSLFVMAKSRDIHKVFGLDDTQLREYITSFENELAICQPQVLRSLQTDNSYKNKLYNTLFSHIEHEIENEKDKLKEEDPIKQLADLKYPHKWFPMARRIHRSFILHVGPTNSGKTHNALKALKESNSGVFCGPLRMLAYQVYERMNQEGVPCNLLTGQQRINVDEATHSACTVEMVSTTEMVDVAVIDEFQMMADLERGFAWTRAILGIPAREIHLCGDNTAVELVRRLVEVTGDSLTINYHERLSPLVVDSKPTSLDKLQKGDCVVAFSRREVINLKQKIQTLNKGVECSVVYGALPPEARVAQTLSFNDPQSNTDIIVATDAIGMGLNLNIQRVIFSAIHKYDGKQNRKLNHSELKQIAGRAGRFASQYNIGHVTGLERDFIPHIKNCIEMPNIASERAGVFPMAEQIELFASNRRMDSRVAFSGLLSMFIEYTELDQLYFLEDIDEKMDVAKLIDHIEMSVSDRYVYITSPLKGGEEVENYFVRLATLHSKGQPVTLGIQVPRPENVTSKSSYLEKLETAYAKVDLYLYLGIRFKFNNLSEAQQMVIDINQRINQTLEQLGPRQKKSSKNIKKGYSNDPNDDNYLIKI